MTLRPLMTWLLARVGTLRAPFDAAARCRCAATAELRNGREGADGEAEELARAVAADAEVIRTAIAAERRHLGALRANGTIGDAAFQQIEQGLDWKELDLQQLMQA